MGQKCAIIYSIWSKKWHTISSTQFKPLKACDSVSQICLPNSVCQKMLILCPCTNVGQNDPRLSQTYCYGSEQTLILFKMFQREEKNAFQSLGTGNRIATWLFYVSCFFWHIMMTLHFLPAYSFLYCKLKCSAARFEAMASVFFPFCVNSKNITNWLK